MARPPGFLANWRCRAVRNCSERAVISLESLEVRGEFTRGSVETEGNAAFGDGFGGVAGDHDQRRNGGGAAPPRRDDATGPQPDRRENAGAWPDENVVFDPN